MAEQWQLIKNLDQLRNLLQGGESESFESFFVLLQIMQVGLY